MSEWKKYPSERSEWTLEEARQKIKSYENVYHGIDLGDGCILGKIGHGTSGQWRWENLVRTSVPSFKNKRVLDLGCNAGIYCIGSCEEGSMEVVGVENNSEYHDQAIFVKSFLEWKRQKKYPITYLHKNIDSFLDDPKIGSFDIVILGNLIYHHFLERELELLEKVKRLLPEIIIVTGNAKTIGGGGTADELQILMKTAGLLGVSVINLFNETSVLRGFWSIPQFKYKIVEIDIGDLFVGAWKISDSPFVNFLRQYKSKTVATEDTELWQYAIVQTTRSLIKDMKTNITVDDCLGMARNYCMSFVRMEKKLTDEPYLSGEYHSSYIPVFMDGEKIRIFNGIHRASVLHFLGHKKVKVCLLEISEIEKWRFYAETDLLGIILGGKV